MVWMVRKHHKEVNKNWPADVITTLHRSEEEAIKHMREAYMPALENKGFYEYTKMEHYDLANSDQMYLVQPHWHNTDEEEPCEDAYWSSPPMGVQGKNVAAYLDACMEEAHKGCVKDKAGNCDAGCSIERDGIGIRPANEMVWTPGAKVKW